VCSRGTKRKFDKDKKCFHSKDRVFLRGGKHQKPTHVPLLHAVSTQKLKEKLDSALPIQLLEALPLTTVAA